MATHVLQGGKAEKRAQDDDDDGDGAMGLAYHLSGLRNTLECMYMRVYIYDQEDNSTLATTSHDNSSNIKSEAAAATTAATSTKVKLFGATKAIRLIGVSVCVCSRALKKIIRMLGTYNNILCFIYYIFIS